jgi:hypothetical protein
VGAHRRPLQAGARRAKESYVAAPEGQLASGIHSLEGYMHKSKLLLASLIALALAAPAANATIWQDNSVHYWAGTAFAEPNIPFTAFGGPVPESTNIYKNIFSFTHASGYAHGGNFLNIDVLFSGPKDNAHNVTGSGAAEMYLVYRHHVGLNSFIASKPFEAGILRDINIMAGTDINTKNTDFASEKIMPIVGLEASFAVPGFLNIGVSYSREYNINGVSGKTVKFDPALQINAAWHINLPLGALSFQGFGNVVLPKGKDGFGGDTVTEILLHPKFMYDVGTFFDSKGYEVGIGVQYWLNKFGNDHTALSGCAENALFGELAIHL